MKKCKYCQTEIDKKAKVCPNCKKKQSHIFRWILLGYEYVKATIKIENKSDKKISYNALDFQMVNGDGVEASVYSVTAEDDVQLNSGELDAGGKVEGVIIWEQKQGDSGLKIRYYENVLFDDEYTFQWTLD